MKNVPVPDPLAAPHLRSPGILEIFRDLVTGRTRPIHCVQVEVTSRCPARCTYCPHTTAAEGWRFRHMEDTTFAALWPLMRQSGRIHLQGWGEPLLHPRFFDYAALARKADCHVSTTSCGLRMDVEVAEAIVKSGMDIMAFSLAGTDTQSNDARQGVPFDRVCAAINTLQSVRKKRLGVHLEIHLAYILLADRVDALRRLPALMDELDVHAAVISTLDYIAVPEHATLAFAPQETEKIDEARALLQETASQVRARGRALHYALPAPTPSVDCRENIQNTLYVDADGMVSPCIYVNIPDNTPKAYVFGNINDQEPLKIWESEPFAAFRRAQREGCPAPPCIHCPKRFEDTNEQPATP